MTTPEHVQEAITNWLDRYQPRPFWKARSASLDAAYDFLRDTVNGPPPEAVLLSGTALARTVRNDLEMHSMPVNPDTFHYFAHALLERVAFNFKKPLPSLPELKTHVPLERLSF